MTRTAIVLRSLNGQALRPIKHTWPEVALAAVRSHADQARREGAEILSETASAVTFRNTAAHGGGLLTYEART